MLVQRSSQGDVVESFHFCPHLLEGFTWTAP